MSFWINSQQETPSPNPGRGLLSETQTLSTGGEPLPANPNLLTIPFFRLWRLCNVQQQQLNRRWGAMTGGADTAGCWTQIVDGPGLLSGSWEPEPPVCTHAVCLPEHKRWPHFWVPWTMSPTPRQDPHRHCLPFPQDVASTLFPRTPPVAPLLGAPSETRLGPLRPLHRSSPFPDELTPRSGYSGLLCLLPPALDPQVCTRHRS